MVHPKATPHMEKCHIFCDTVSLRNYCPITFGGGSEKYEAS